MSVFITKLDPMFRQEVKTSILPFSAHTWSKEVDFQEHQNILRGSVSTLETGNNGKPILSSGSENLPPKNTNANTGRTQS